MKKYISPLSIPEFLGLWFLKNRKGSFEVRCSLAMDGAIDVTGQVLRWGNDGQLMEHMVTGSEQPLASGGRVKCL